MIPSTQYVKQLLIESNLSSEARTVAKGLRKDLKRAELNYFKNSMPQ